MNELSILQHKDQMTFNYLKQYDLFNHANKDMHLTNRTDTLALMISSELGYGVMPLEYAKPYLLDKQLVQINDKNIYSHQLALVWVHHDINNLNIFLL